MRGKVKYLAEDEIVAINKEVLEKLKAKKADVEPKVKEDAKILQGIRENYYSAREIKAWIKGGDLREFKR